MFWNHATILTGKTAYAWLCVSLDIKKSVPATGVSLLAFLRHIITLLLLMNEEERFYPIYHKRA